MQNFRKFLIPALFIGFLFIGLITFMESKPSSKNRRVYTTVQKFSPYRLEKRFGGLKIINKENPEFKEEPNNMTLFQEFERLEREWGKRHLKLSKDLLIITDNNGRTIHTLQLQTKDEAAFVHNYYGI
jgi:hypothetical protein